MCGEGMGWESYVMMGVLAVLLIGFMLFSSFRNKKKSAETAEMKSKMAPGDKVRTAGGIIGIVDEVDRVEGTITVSTGGSTVKFAMDVVYPVEYFERFAKQPAGQKSAGTENSNNEISENTAESSLENMDTINADFLDAPRDDFEIETKPKAKKSKKSAEKSTDDTAKFE